MVCVSWNGAMTYVQWLSRGTGKRFRLPTEAKSEYAALAGTMSARHRDESPRAYSFALCAFSLWRGVQGRSPCARGYARG